MRAINFISDDINRFTKGVQKLANLSIGTNHTGTRVDHKNDNISFMNGSMRLLRHIIINIATTIIRFTNTTGVYNDERFVFIGCITVLTITSQP